MMLGDLGARVIKVEAPGHGDDTRGWGPPFVGEPDARAVDVLPLRQPQQGVDRPRPQGRGRPRRPAAAGRPGRRAGRELPHRRPRAARPRHRVAAASATRALVVLSITGFGHDGPEGGRAGYDQIAQGEAGLMSLTGSGPDDPQRVGVPIADLLAGMYGAYGVVAALHERATAPASAPWSARRCWPRSSGCTRSREPDGPSRARSAARRATTTRRSRRTGCSAAATARSRSPSAARASGEGSATASGSTRRPRAWPPTAERVADRERVLEVVEAAFADLGRRAAARPAGRARRARRQGAHARRGLRLGPDGQPGTARRRRPPHAGPDHPARPAAALLRSRRERADPHAPTPPRPSSTQDHAAVAAWLGRPDDLVAPGRVAVTRRWPRPS